MHCAIRLAGYSLMTMFVSCGVGAQDLDTQIRKAALENSLPAQEAILCFYTGSMASEPPSRPVLDAVTAVE